MKFKMNNQNWTIEEISQEKLKEENNDTDIHTWYHGLTVYSSNKIYLWKDMTIDVKRQTLLHELMHCYIGCYCSFQDMQYTEDILCNICANSHDIIHEIVEKYFKDSDKNE